MNRAIEAIEYLIGVHSQKLAEIPAYPCETEEGRAHLDLWAGDLKKEIQLLNGVLSHLRRKQRKIRTLWAAIVLAALILPVVGAAAYLKGRVDEGNEWVTIDDTQFCERLGADIPKVHFE